MIAIAGFEVRLAEREGWGVEGWGWEGEVAAHNEYIVIDAWIFD